MELGPQGTSLLQRLGKEPDPPEALRIALDQAERSETRRLARIRYGAKHKAKVKPLAPVEERGITIINGEKKRMWAWVGEKLPAKLTSILMPNASEVIYSSEELREAGFKLPKLKRKSK